MSCFIPAEAPEGFSFIDAAQAFHAELQDLIRANPETAIVLNHIAEHFPDPLISRIKHSTTFSTVEESAKFVVSQFFSGNWSVLFETTDGRWLRGREEFNTLPQGLIFADSKHWTSVEDLIADGHIMDEDKNEEPRRRTDSDPSVNRFHVIRTNPLGEETLRIHTSF